jgi:hypothetical protein
VSYDEVLKLRNRVQALSGQLEGLRGSSVSMQLSPYTPSEGVDSSGGAPLAGRTSFGGFRARGASTDLAASAASAASTSGPHQRSAPGGLFSPAASAPPPSLAVSPATPFETAEHASRVQAELLAAYEHYSDRLYTLLCAQAVHTDNMKVR